MGGFFCGRSGNPSSGLAVVPIDTGTGSANAYALLAFLPPMLPLAAFLKVYTSSPAVGGLAEAATESGLGVD